MLLTALARGHAPAVVLTVGAPVPDPATLTSDTRDLESFRSMGLDLAVQPTEKIVNLLLEAGGFRRFHLRKTDGLIRTSLVSHDGATSTTFDFKITKRSVDGRVQIEIAPVRAA
jgi:hypothetical protein